MATGYVYILASRRAGTLYVGMTADLVRRVFEHKTGTPGSFTQRYRVDRLVHFEVYDDIADARQRERNLKHWPRRWKIALIERTNPEWRDQREKIA